LDDGNRCARIGGVKRRVGDGAQKFHTIAGAKMVCERFELGPQGAIAGDLIFEARQNLHLSRSPVASLVTVKIVAASRMFASSGDFSGSTAFGNRLNLANGTWYSRAIVAAVKELTEAILVTARRNQGSNQRFSRGMRGSFQTKGLAGLDAGTGSNRDEKVGLRHRSPRRAGHES
jgi:hypothetical protein